jgi:cytochrome oxidase Cu insertion factor (SCO1/SenC/PrrC family)
VLVVVSVNPQDTPASVRAAVRSWGLAGLAPWHWLMGSHARLAPVWRAYHIFVKPTRGDISHTEALYLLDRRGDERSGYLFPYLPASVTDDMRVLAGRTGGERE